MLPRQEAGDGEPPVEALRRELSVLMIRVVVAGYAAEQGDVSVGKGAAEHEGSSNLQFIKCFTQPLLELWRCFGHGLSDCSSR